MPFLPPRMGSVCAWSNKNYAFHSLIYSSRLDPWQCRMHLEARGWFIGTEGVELIQQQLEKNDATLDDIIAAAKDVMRLKNDH